MAGIGSIGVTVTADTASFESAMNRTQQIAAASMARVEQANKIAQAAADKFVKSLQYQVDTFGKSEAEIARYKASMLGAGDAAAPLIARLEELNKAAGGTAGSLRGATAEGTHGMEGFSFATAGAKRELLVLAHELSQGNFSRFGGSLLVLGERTGAAALLFSPLTLGIIAATGALALLGQQVYKGHEDWIALGNSIKSTGDYTGYTQHQLDQMSVYFARSTKEIQDGREALTALIATGRFSGDQLQAVGRAALDMADDTDKSIEDITKELAKLPDGARKWAEEYQKTHHVFTAANIELIDSLDKQGKQAEATVAVLNALDEAHKRISSDMQQKKGIWDRFWDDWADGLARIKKGLRELGAPESYFDQINDALRIRANLENSLATMRGRGDKESRDQIPAIQRQLAANLALIDSLRKLDDTQKQRAKDNAALGAGGDNQIKVDKYLDGGAKSDKQKYLDRVAEENKAYQETIANLKANTAQYEAVVRHHKENLAEIEKEYAKKTAPKEYQDSAATKFLQRLRDEDAQIRAQLASVTGITAAKKEQVAFEQQIADFAGKKLTKEQQSLVDNQAAIRAQLTKNTADAEELRLKGEIEKLDQRAAQINEQMASNRIGRSEQYQRQLGAFGMGREAQQRVAAVQAIYKEYQRYEDQLTKSTPKDMLGSKEYMDAVEKIRAGLGKSLADYDAYYAALKEKQGDWTNGASQAVQDYLDSAQNVAAQSQEAFAHAFKGAEDAIVQFVTTGKLNFASLVTSILADIARIEARKMVASGVNALLDFGASALGFDFGGGISDVTAASVRNDEMNRIMGQLDGARANGGPVSGGSSYLVGEVGPEIFSPSGSGTIIPNHMLGGGGGITINIETNVSDNGASSTASGDAGGARAAADMLNARIKAVVMQETRPGGSIWNYQNKGVAA